MCRPLDHIGPGSKVMLHFTIALEDGMVAESTFDDEPVEFVIGRGELQEGLERALYGLKTGDNQTFTILPEQGFGLRDARAEQLLARDEFPAQIPIEPGVIIEFTTPRGDEVPGTIKAITHDQVNVDFNHPLAGHKIKFTVKILAVSNPKRD